MKHLINFFLTLCLVFSSVISLMFIFFYLSSFHLKLEHIHFIIYISPVLPYVLFLQTPLALNISGITLTLLTLIPIHFVYYYFFLRLTFYKINKLKVKKIKLLKTLVFILLNFIILLPAIIFNLFYFN